MTDVSMTCPPTSCRTLIAPGGSPRSRRRGPRSPAWTLGKADQRHVCHRCRRRAGAGSGIGSAMVGGRAAERARRRTDHDQGQHRCRWHPGAARHRGRRHDPERHRRAAGARVREAGCVLLGKTTMPDFGMLVSGVSSLHGITRNPWDLTRNPGGSSSGAGA